jgi:phosphoglycolate phosphatase/pyrophosphatase PpaX
MCPLPFEGMKEVLETLKNKGVYIAMVTGKGKQSTDISLERFGLADFFEIIETGSPTGARKVEGIQLIMDTLGAVEKGEVVYVGDAPSDILACRKVGIPIVAAAWASTAEPEVLEGMGPDELFYNIPDFSDWLYGRI